MPNDVELSIVKAAKHHDAHQYRIFLAHKLARAVYYMLKRHTALDMEQCRHG